MRVQPEQEKNIISWCLQNPTDFWSLADRVGPETFRAAPWDKLWPLLHRGYQLHHEFPSIQELGGITAKLDVPPQERLHYAYALRQAFSHDVSKYTGEEVRSWVAHQEIGLLGEKMSRTESSTHDLAAQIEYYQERLDKVKLLAGAGKSIGKPFQPLKEQGRWWEEVEEEYGANPITSGCYRLDNKLRGRGIRPTLVLIVGPTGGGKSSFLLHTSFANVRKGLRWVYYILDDNPGEFRERYTSHLLQREITLDDLLPENRERVGELAAYRAAKDYPGEWYGIPAAPDKWGPQDFLRDLQDLQRGFLADDMRRIRSGETLAHPPGHIAGVSIDTGDQVRPSRHYKDGWLEQEKGYSELSYIPRKLKCPLFLGVQGNQESVGASQLTLRNVGGSYGKAKPAKLILAVAQTVAQSQHRTTIDWNLQPWQDNKAHIWSASPQVDRDSQWEEISLCVVKNTTGPKNIILPLLINWGSCRIMENYPKSEELMRASNRTLLEERQANGEAPLPRNDKRGTK